MFELFKKHLNSSDSTARSHIHIKQSWLENPPHESLHSAGVRNSVLAFTVH